MTDNERIEEYRQKVKTGEMKPADAARELAGWLACTAKQASLKLSGEHARRGATRRF